MEKGEGRKEKEEIAKGERQQKRRRFGKEH